ncbi:MAG: glycosyltransferase [Lacrimispora saccharolytica]
MKYILQIPAHLSIGGVEKVARDIGLYADPKMYKVHYIVFDDFEGEYERELLEHGCKVFHFNEPSLNYLHFLDELKRIMTETRYDIVQAHTMFNIGWIMKAAKKKKIPIRIAHAHSALDTGGGIKVKIYEAVMRHLILHNATDLVACSEKAGIRLFGEKAYRKKGNLILNGVDIESFRFNTDKRARIRKALKIEDNFVIGHAGHLVAVKNQKFLLSIMPDILKHRPESKLLLLGDGLDRKMLENTVEKTAFTESCYPDRKCE